MKVDSKWIRNKSDEIAASKEYYFDERKGLRVVAFMEKFFSHYEGLKAGEPFKLLDWQVNDFILPLFSWMKPDGTRRFRQASIWIPKKNGKTFCCSAIANYFLLADGEVNPKILIAANEYKQAQILVNGSWQLLQNSEGLSREVAKMQMNSKFGEANNISYGQAGYIKGLSYPKKAKSMHGYNAHAVIIDELGFMEGRLLWDALKYATRGREQGMLITISTAADSLVGLGYEQYKLAKEIKDSISEDPPLHKFALIYEAGPEDDLLDKSTWYKTNPSMGESFKEEDFEQDLKESMQSPAGFANFKNKSFNIWTDAESAEGLVYQDVWKANAKPVNHADFDNPYDLKDVEKGYQKQYLKPVWIGLDLSKSQDLTSAVLIFPEDPTDSNSPVTVFPFTWIPAENQEALEKKEKLEKCPYRRWAADYKNTGVSIVYDRIIDYHNVAETLVRLSYKYNIQFIGFDPALSQFLKEELSDEYGLPMYEMSMKVTFQSQALKFLQTQLLAEKVNHMNNPILDVEHKGLATQENNTGLLYITKNFCKSKIDAIVALAIGMYCFRLTLGQDLNTATANDIMFI